MMQSDLQTDTRGEILRAGLAEADGPIFFVNPTREMMQEFVDTYQEIDQSPAVRLFADQTPLKELTDDFLVASELADLVAENEVSIRVLAPVPRHSLLLTEDSLVSLVDERDTICGLSTDDEACVNSTYDHYVDRWETAESFSLRTPPRSHVQETLSEEISNEVATDFDRALDTLDCARGNGEGLDEVTVSLLVAANNGELLYDISRWGENIRLASKATFSRTKNRLEDNGLIDTEKVPIDVGRPRLRLLLDSRELREAEIETVTERAKSRLH